MRDCIRTIISPASLSGGVRSNRGIMATLKSKEIAAGGEDAKMHVLVVDDNPLDRKMAEMLLSGSPFRVTSVDSPKKALEILGIRDQNDGSSSSNAKAVGVSLILSDYCMPEMTGYDLLKRVKGSSVHKDIPVVIMSSDDIPSRISSCKEEGAEDYLLKPLRKEDVPRFTKFLRITN